MYEKLRLDPRLDKFSSKELQAKLLEIYEKRKNPIGRLYNNATNKNEVMSLEAFTNKYLNEPVILSGYSCLYENQENSINISSAALKNLGDMRKFNKSKMEAAEHGSNEYIYYRVLQLTYKVLMNSYYGILGEKNSVFYNPFVQNSITMTGQDLITTAIIGMESFLSNNVPFEDTDDILTFINNVITVEPVVDVLNYLDVPKNSEEVYNYLLDHSTDIEKVDKETIYSVVKNLSLENLNRVFYANNLMDLLEHSFFKTKISQMLEFKYENKPEDGMKPYLEEFKRVVLGISYYERLFEQRYKRALNHKRKTVITIDTDSVFININKYIKQANRNLNLETDNKIQQMTLINIFINLTTGALDKLFHLLTTNMGLLEESKPLINMKQEFLYEKIMLTSNKKNYGGIITAELGKKLTHPVLDIKGLSIKKTTVCKPLRKSFTDILQHDILEPEKINLLKVIEKYDDLGISIEKSLMNGETLYLLPKNVEIVNNYKNPASMEQVRALLTWNALEPDESVIPPEKVNIVKLKTHLMNGFENLTMKGIDDISSGYLQCPDYLSEEVKHLIKFYPEKAKTILNAVFNKDGKNMVDFSKFGFSVIAIPKSVEKIPEYIIPFIDLSAMKNLNMTNGYILLESLGIYCDTVATTKYKSNIISI